jgi:voltage-gated potassium channel Kch
MILKHLAGHPFLPFLIFILNGIAYPLYARNIQVQDLLSTINYSLILISGLYAFNQEKRFLRITGALFILVLILTWTQFFLNRPLLDRLQPVATSVMLVLLLILTFRSIISATHVDKNVIFGVVAGYILIGFVGGLLALAIARSDPGAFNLQGTFNPPEAIYFSFVTMTTLGYGDITPAIQPSRSLSILLSIAGPMYVAIVIALMVGKYATRKSR